MSDFYYGQPDELYHYGVLGMKWGVRRSLYKNKRNQKLAKKAVKYDKESAKLVAKAEKKHAINDLGRANNRAVNSAKYAVKSAKFQKKALKAKSDIGAAYYTKKATHMDCSLYVFLQNRTHKSLILKLLFNISF